MGIMLILLCGVGPVQTPYVDRPALEKAFRAGLPGGWKFVSGRLVCYRSREQPWMWLATVKPDRAGNYTLVARIDHDEAPTSYWGVHSVCQYFIGVDKPGTPRAVSDLSALPQCNVGDQLTIPIPVRPRDHSWRFTLTAEAKPQRWHILGREAGKRMLATEEKKPAYKVVHPEPKALRLIHAGGKSFSKLRSGGPPYHVTQIVTLEATLPGRWTLLSPIEVVAADQAVTGYVGSWHYSRLREKPKKDTPEHHYKGGTHGTGFAGAPCWQMRVGDRLQVGFAAGTVEDRTDPVPDLTLPVERYREPEEPLPTWRW